MLRALKVLVLMCWLYSLAVFVFFLGRMFV
jgi:hypothetical protein